MLKGLSLKIGISYSWDSPEHRQWVARLADAVARAGVAVEVDDRVRLGADLNHFMEQLITRSDRLLVVCTPNYKTKVDSRIGPAGFEGSLITAELIANHPSHKFVPLLRAGTWADAIPVSLQGRKGLDMRDDGMFAARIEELLSDVRMDSTPHVPAARPSPPPPVSQPVQTERSRPAPAEAVRLPAVSRPETKPAPTRSRKRRLMMQALALGMVAVAALAWWLLRGGAGSPEPPIRVGFLPWGDPILAHLLKSRSVQGTEFSSLPDSIGALASLRTDLAIVDLCTGVAAERNEANVQFVYPLYAISFYTMVGRRDAGFTSRDELIRAGHKPEDATVRALAQLRGKRIGLPEGLNSAAAWSRLKSLVKLEDKDFVVLKMQPQDSTSGLLSGHVDAALIFSSRHFGDPEWPVLATARDLRSEMTVGLTVRKGSGDGMQVPKVFLKRWYAAVQELGPKMISGSHPLPERFSQAVSPRTYWTELTRYPGNAEETEKVFFRHDSPVYWREAWVSCNESLGRPSPSAGQVSSMDSLVESMRSR